MIIEPWVIHMLEHLMSQPLRGYPVLGSLLTSLKSIMVCNDVISVYLVGEQQQGFDTQHDYHNDRAPSTVRAYAVRLNG